MGSGAGRARTHTSTGPSLGRALRPWMCSRDVVLLHFHKVGHSHLRPFSESLTRPLGSSAATAVPAASLQGTDWRVPCGVRCPSSHQPAAGQRPPCRRVPTWLWCEDAARVLFCENRADLSARSSLAPGAWLSTVQACAVKRATVTVIPGRCSSRPRSLRPIPSGFARGGCCPSAPSPRGFPSRSRPGRPDFASQGPCSGGVRPWSLVSGFSGRAPCPPASGRRSVCVFLSRAEEHPFVWPGLLSPPGSTARWLLGSERPVPLGVASCLSLCCAHPGPPRSGPGARAEPAFPHSRGEGLRVSGPRAVLSGSGPCSVGGPRSAARWAWALPEPRVLPGCRWRGRAVTGSRITPRAAQGHGWLELLFLTLLHLWPLSRGTDLEGARGPASRVPAALLRLEPFAAWGAV